MMTIAAIYFILAMCVPVALNLQEKVEGGISHE